MFTCTFVFSKYTRIPKKYLTLSNSFSFLGPGHEAEILCSEGHEWTYVKTAGKIATRVRCTQLKNRKPSRGTHLIHFLDLKRICFHKFFILKSVKTLGENTKRKEKELQILV